MQIPIGSEIGWSLAASLVFAERVAVRNLRIVDFCRKLYETVYVCHVRVIGLCM
jgi:hypothetical protein